MEILDDEDEWTPGGCEFERRPPGREEGRAVHDVDVGRSDGRGEELGRLDRGFGPGILQPGTGANADGLRSRVGLGELEEAQQDGAHRPVGESLSVRHALGHCDLRDGCDGRKPEQELLDQPALAGPRRGDDAHQVGPALDQGAARDELQHADIRVAADERGSRAGDHGWPDERPRRDRPGLAAQVHGPRRPERIGAEGRARGPGAGQDLPRLGLLLETGRDIDRVSGHQEVAFIAIAVGDDLAGVHPDPDRQLVAERRVVADTITQLECCIQGATRVVVMGLRDAEDGHRGVTDELLQGPGVLLDHLLGDLVEAGQKAPQVLWIPGLADGRGTDHIREQDGDKPALFGHARMVRGAARGQAHWRR